MQLCGKEVNLNIFYNRWGLGLRDDYWFQVYVIQTVHGAYKIVYAPWLWWLRIIMSTQCINEELFQNTYQYLCDKARKAIFSSQRMTKSLNPLSPKLKSHIFDTLIRPALTCGSDVWGHKKSGLKEIDRVFLRYIRCVLNVKATTSNIIVIGECEYPPSVFCCVSLIDWTICQTPKWPKKYIMSCSNYIKMASQTGSLMW